MQEFVRFARPPKLVRNLTDVNELIKSVVKLLEQQAAAQKVMVSKELASDLPPVALDGEQIEQVLLNFVINALQAMPNGGTLVFRTFQEKATATIEVEDTVAGIPPNVIGRIFDPFFTTKDKGSGLGLSVAHKIITQHEGRLVAENTSPGTIFRLTLKTIL